jgi:predicted dehydrogenase
MTKKQISLAVVGAGLIGRRHIQAISSTDEATLHCIVDPAAQARELAQSLQVPWFAEPDEMVAQTKPDGVILATPNAMHVDQGIRCINRGIAVLVEKPLADSVVGAEKLVTSGEQSGVPVLTGHHRRYNSLMQRAKAAIDDGKIGKVVSVNVMTWLYKPDDYFDVSWRREPGAGPVFINLIHDIDAMHYLCGPIRSVVAFESSQTRHNRVEDSAVATLQFESGALGTVNLSDTIVAPWSWELTARENPAYPPTPNACYLIGGTHGSLELPGLRIWRNGEQRSWWNPIDSTQLQHDFEDPLICQIRHFAAVIRGDEQPLVSGRDGLQALRVLEAIKASARDQRVVQVD